MSQKPRISVFYPPTTEEGIAVVLRDFYHECDESPDSTGSLQVIPSSTGDMTRFEVDSALHEGKRVVVSVLRTRLERSLGPTFDETAFEDALIFLAGLYREAEPEMVHWDR